MKVSGLIPARFLTLVAHLVIIVVILWSREENVKSCLPLRFTTTQYDEKDLELIIGLSVALGCLAIELVGFVGGISMFMPFQCLLSLTFHCAGCIGLSWFSFTLWPCYRYWYLFPMSAVPAFTEIIAMLNVGCCPFILHGFGTFLLFLFLFQYWSCDLYWYIFAFCSVIPSLTEILIWIATAAHTSGAVSLTYFLFYLWPCTIFWYIFSFCSAFPAITEIIVMIGVGCCRKGI